MSPDIIPSAGMLQRTGKFLPSDLYSDARKHGAFKRLRGFVSAPGLLHACLLYVAKNLSFKDAAALISVGGVTISTSSLHERVAAAADWIESLLAYVLTGGGESPTDTSRRLRIVDATSLSGPGSRGTDWRVHALYDQASGCIRSVRLTDARGGESVDKHPLDRGCFALFDRAYPTSKNIRDLKACGAHYLIRFVAGNMRLCDVDGNRIKPWLMEDAITCEAPLDKPVLVPIKPKGACGPYWHESPGVAWVAARLIGVRIPCGRVMWLVTNASEDEAEGAALAALYRFRWQIELMFKRLKSLAGLDRLKSRNGPTARAWVLAKLLLTAIAQRLVRPNGPIDHPVPTGIGGVTPAHRHSAWSRIRMAHNALEQIITGDLVLRLIANETAMLRMENSRRARLQQPPIPPLHPASKLMKLA